MEVVVKFHESARPGLGAWVRSLPGRPAGRALLIAICLEAVNVALRDTEGQPPGAVRVEGIWPPTCWWEFTPGWWLRYCVRETGGWLRRRRKEITILEVAPRRADETPQ
jgi:hypothetical protein